MGETIDIIIKEEVIQNEEIEIKSFENLSNKINEIYKKMEEIDNKLTTIQKDINYIKSGSDMINEHIGFVESVYDTVKSPFYYIMNKIKTIERIPESPNRIKNN